MPGQLRGPAPGSSTPLPTPNPSVVFCEVEDGAVLLSTEAEVYYGLNQVGARVWALLPPTETTLEGLCLRLSQEYPEVSLELLRTDVTALLQDLVQSDLLAPPAGGSTASKV